MKRFCQLLFVLSTIITTIASCKKDNIVQQPENVSAITASTGYGDVIFNWNYTDSNYKYVSIQYVNDDGDIVKKYFSGTTTTAVIDSLTNKKYIFTFTAVNQSNIASKTEIIVATPNDAVCNIVTAASSITATYGGAVIKWTNNTNNKVGVKISYIDTSGTTQIIQDTSSLATDSILATGIVKSTDYSFEFYDIGGKISRKGTTQYATIKPIAYTAQLLAGTYTVITDTWGDFAQQNLTEATITAVNDSTFSFVSPYTSSDKTNHSLNVKIVNPYSLELSAYSTDYADYYGYGNSTAYTSGGISKNYISTADHTIHLNLNYILPKMSTYTNFVLVATQITKIGCHIFVIAYFYRSIIGFLLQLEHRQECLLRNFYIADLTHTFLTFFLFFK